MHLIRPLVNSMKKTLEVTMKQAKKAFLHLVTALSVVAGTLVVGTALAPSAYANQLGSFSCPEWQTVHIVSTHSGGGRAVHTASNGHHASGYSRFISNTGARSVAWTNVTANNLQSHTRQCHGV